MSAEAILRLSLRVQADYLNGGHVAYVVGDYNAVASVGNYVADLAGQAAASAAAASGSLATQLALGAPANGVGNEPMDLPRVSLFNAEAFRDWQMAASLFPNLQNANYQLTAHDLAKLVYATSGTRTYTLPLAADVWPGWHCRLRNRSGSNLTLNPGGAGDAINGGSAGAGITIATGSAILTVVCTGTTAFEVA